MRKMWELVASQYGPESVSMQFFSQQLPIRFDHKRRCNGFVDTAMTTPDPGAVGDENIDDAFGGSSLGRLLQLSYSRASRQRAGLYGESLGTPRPRPPLEPGCARHHPSSFPWHFRPRALASQALHAHRRLGQTCPHQRSNQCGVKGHVASPLERQVAPLSSAASATTSHRVSRRRH